MTWFEGFDPAVHQLDGIRLFARSGGRRDGPPLRMLHGFPQTHAMWHRVARRLARAAHAGGAFHRRRVAAGDGGGVAGFLVSWRAAASLHRGGAATRDICHGL